MFAHILALLVLLLLGAGEAIPGSWRDTAGNEPDRPALNLAQKILSSFTQTSKVLKRRTASSPSVSIALDTESTQVSISEAAEKVAHTIIIPNYNEDVGTLRETRDVLAGNPRARSQYEVRTSPSGQVTGRLTSQIYLAMGQKEVWAAKKAGTLVCAYEKSFAFIHATFHPACLPSEIAGKSSNIHQAELVSGTCDVIITVMDADTNLWQDYFTEIRRLHYAHPTSSNRTLYSCPIIFDRNSNDGPVCVLTSIGEDMHTMLKCYFKTHGNVASQVVQAPASPCNHMWGAPDPGFAARNILRLVRHLALMHLLWEAHFLPCHFTILLLFSMAYEQTASYTVTPLHPAMAFVFTPVVFLRALLFIWMNMFTLIQQMILRSAVLVVDIGLGERGTGFSDRTPWYRLTFLLEQIAFPIAGTVSGPVPMIRAVFVYFWTDRLVHQVSKKPALGVPV
ncbi:hypothetical protein BDW75DRAFT_251259 [Aspergillus navahoensis]